MPAPFKIARYLAAHGLLPRRRVAWFTVYLAGVEAVLLLLKYVLQAAKAGAAAGALRGWTGFLGFVLFVLLLFLGIRWFRGYLLWRLRNRLIVTYLFIGGVPVVLVICMALISGYLLGEQFAAFLVVADIQAKLQRLQTANAATAEQAARRADIGNSTAPQKITPDDTVFLNRTVTVAPDAARPSWLKGDYTGLAFDENALSLRAIKEISVRGKKLLVISSVPVDQKFMAQTAINLGPLDLYLPIKDVSGNTNIDINNKEGVKINGKPGAKLSAGTMPPRQYTGDIEFPYLSVIQATDWSNGENTSPVLSGTTRVSALYSHLSVSVSKWADVISFALTGLAIAFAVIVLVALLIGLRLTRTITLSVANLYEATQHINRGDFSHRIPVKEKDQLAALQVAFNSMTESVEKLIEEQKEKERLQSELAIAQEVQAQLFPTAMSSTRTLELHGICRPARIVSGDYYDFLPYGSEQIGIAIGDISGKGISAALLMATIHSAVRAYEQEQLIAVSTAMNSPQNTRSGSVGLAIRHAPPQSASQVLWLLNRQLYKSTPPEKYATLFLGFYDGNSRQFSYSNGGHLPPLILGSDGSARRLDCGGTVIGLFNDVPYEEATVEFQPGDIFVAFSDGITEPENEFGEFGEERLIETIEANRHLSLERITEQVIAAVQAWIGSVEQPDDITLVLARARE